MGMRLAEISLSPAINDAAYDAVIVISHSLNAVLEHEKAKCLHESLSAFSKIHSGIDSGKPVLLSSNSIPSQRLFYSGIGTAFSRDYNDVRQYIEAGKSSLVAALASGVRSPLLVVVPNERFENAQLAATLGVLHKLHVPLNIRTESPERSLKIDRLGILHLANGDEGKFLRHVKSLQSSFTVCRDIGESDPIRMAPPKVAEYVQEHFKGTSITVKVIRKYEYLEGNYPLLAAVNRAAYSVATHGACVIWLEYENKEDSGKEFETLGLVGKGVTLDTGGADVKTGGGMMGMSMDKYGSAVVAGFFDALDKLQPKGIKVIGAMCVVRNSIGSDSYTTDEIITSRSGKRILICNTDAEGRLAMLDPLTEMRERAMNETNPQLYTLATLTGHEVLSYGFIPAIMDNGPAAEANHAQKLQQTGDKFGQPLEISRIHPEDYSYNDSPTEAADLRQGGNRPSVQTLRGHQSPCAFLIRGSRLDEHDRLSAKPIKYAHIDIGSSMGEYPQTTFPCPLLALTAQ